MSLHNEIQFETNICNHLGAHGWLYAPSGSDGDVHAYDTAHVPIFSVVSKRISLYRHYLGQIYKQTTKKTFVSACSRQTKKLKSQIP